MTIEIETPHNKATEKLIKYITTEIVKFSHAIKKISRAEILLKEDEKMHGENKICDIRLSILGGNLSAHSRNGNFETAAEEAIKELYRLDKEQIKAKNRTPGKTSGACKTLSINN